MFFGQRSSDVCNIAMWSFAMRVVKFKEFGGVLPHSEGAGWSWRPRFICMTTETNFFKQIENKQHVQMSFRCVLPK